MPYLKCPACGSLSIQYLEHIQECVCMSCKFQNYDSLFDVQQMNTFPPPYSDNEDRKMNKIRAGFVPHTFTHPHPISLPPVLPEQSIKDVEVVSNGGTQFDTGAVRSSDKAGVRYDLISPIGLRRIAETYKEGYDKYGAFNWERGMPISDILTHAIAHIYAYLSGEETNEDDLAHAAWNLIAAMHMEETHPNINHELRPNHPMTKKYYEKQSIAAPNNTPTT